MRTCRSCSPTPKTSLRTCKPDCSKQCCLPRRRCRSLSPKRSAARRFFEHCNVSPCKICDPLCICDLCRPYGSCRSPRRRKCGPRICSPCRPRSCCFTDNDLPGRKHCVSGRIDSTVRCNYVPCDPSYPCRRDSCSPRACDPCVCRRGPCYSTKLDSYDPCYSLSFRPYYRRKWNSCTSCDPPKCDPCRSMKCDLCYSPRRRTEFGSCLPRPICDIRNPCRYSSCKYCKAGCADTCRVRYPLPPCGNSSALLSRINFRDLECDNFRKVCYPKEVPIKPCTVGDCECGLYNCSCVNSREPPCEVAKVDSIRSSRDEGPSGTFYQKSRRLGNNMGRYDPHQCPWEADVSISGTVRGHCTSTALEVARRMSGRFRAEGDRFTSDSCENKASCLSGVQRMSLGRLDDGTALNFTANNIPTDKQIQDKSNDANKSNKTVSMPTDFSKSNWGIRRNNCIEDHNGDYKTCYTTECRDNSEFNFGNTRSSLLPAGHYRSRDILKDEKVLCSRPSGRHNVRFGSEDEASDYQSASEQKDEPYPLQNNSLSYIEVQNFLNSRKDRRRRNKTSSPVKKAFNYATQRSTSIQRADNERYTSMSPYSHSLRHHNTHTSSNTDSPLFAYQKHYLPLRNNHVSQPCSSDDFDNINLRSLGTENSPARIRSTEYHKEFLESNRVPVNRRRNCRNNLTIDRIVEDREAVNIHD